MDINKLNTSWPNSLKGSDKLPGMHNFRNNCFANSILQVFNHTPALINYFRNHPCNCKKEKQKSEHSYDCYHCSMKEYIDLFEQCYANNTHIVHKEFLKTVMRNHQEFKFGQQADASEFFDHISDKLVDSKKDSILNDIYGSKIANIFRCKSCNNEWRTVTTEHLLLNKGDIKDQLLEKSTEKDCDVKRTCEKCNKLKDCAEKTVINCPPHVLSVKLLDFAPDTKKTVFPEKINIKPYMETNTGGAVVYELYAVVVMTGDVSSSFKHYFAHCKAPSGQWNTYNDESVRNVSVENVLDSRPYLLYYRRYSTEF